MVTMNRPKARNARSGEMLAIMEQAWERANEDPEVRVVILTGAGRAFSAGIDLKETADPMTSEEGERPYRERRLRWCLGSGDA